MFPGLPTIRLPNFDPITNTTLSIFDTFKQFFTGVNESSVDSFVERLNGVFNSLGGDIEKILEQYQVINKDDIFIGSFEEYDDEVKRWICSRE